MIKRLMITTFSILKCLFPDICIYKTISCTLQRVRKITPNINNRAMFEAIIIHQYNEIKTALFLATAGVHGLCIIGSYIFVKCFKNRLKVTCMSEIIDKNIFPGKKHSLH